MKWLAPLVVLSVLSACNERLENPKIEKAWVRLPAVTGQPAAAYFQIVGGASDTGTSLVRIESALVERIEMHESMKGMAGMTSMKPVATVPIEGHVVTTFAPGGKHAMLFGIDPAVTPGTAIPLRFGFAGGRTAEAEAKTVAAGADAPF